MANHLDARLTEYLLIQQSRPPLRLVPIEKFAFSTTTQVPAFPQIINIRLPSGKVINSIVAHVEAISSLAIDPNGLYLLSGSHDGSIRLWNMEKRMCLQVKNNPG